MATKPLHVMTGLWGRKLGKGRKDEKGSGRKEKKRVERIWVTVAVWSDVRWRSQ